MMYDGIINKPPLENVIQHSQSLFVDGFKAYNKYKKNKKKKIGIDTRKDPRYASPDPLHYYKSTGEYKAEKHIRNAYKYGKKAGKAVSKFVDEQNRRTVSAGKAAHKYLYKKLNKNGKVIYVYDTTGKAKLRRTVAVK